MKFAPLWILVALFSFSASSQTAAPILAKASISDPGPKITLFGVKTIEQCSPALKALQAELKTLNYPPEWKVGILCTPVAWNELVRKSELSNVHTGITELKEKYTFLNGAIFTGWPQEYRHTIAHELGHIYCNCVSEYKAEKLAFNIERGNQEKLITQSAGQSKSAIASKR